MAEEEKKDNEKEAQIWSIFKNCQLDGLFHFVTQVTNILTVCYIILMKINYIFK